MAKKRKGGSKRADPSNTIPSKYNIEERFDESEDEFFAGRDKVLVDEGPAAKRQRRLQEQEKDIQPSDEEVLDYTEHDEDDFDDAQSVEGIAQEGTDGEDEENWGTSKADYYNADIIETEADALDEEKEARRIQLKQLKAMTDADFGLDEMAWTQPVRENIPSGPVIEKLPEVTIASGASKEEMLDILHNRYPEFELLARDLVELQATWESLRDRSMNTTETGFEGITVHTKLSALTAYLSAVAMYFAVIASVIDSKADAAKITAFPPNELRDHAIIENLVATRKLWDTVRMAEETKAKQAEYDADRMLKTTHTTVIKQAEDHPPKTNGHNPRIASSRDQLSSLDESDESDKFDDFDMATLPTLQKKKQKSLDLQALLAKSAVSKDVDASDFGDEEPLTAEQAAEKARRKKSLRFYTSQITQKANKRGAASREAGGDDDVPHKERLRDKQERLLKEAEKRGQQKATAEEELGGDSEVDEEMVDNNGYYDSLVANSRRKKADKEAKAQAYAEAARQGAQVYEEEQIGQDGKRRITYAIEKNKGLTPKRKKDVRNPRVKKRKKYDEKMKKLGSIRQVYKGGEGRGGYGGELTGIKTNVVKSVKL